MTDALPLSLAPICRSPVTISRDCDVLSYGLKLVKLGGRRVCRWSFLSFTVW